ncbi:MAG: hypothetical protein A2509_08450 [Candidatus Edwardsbacteria bacterium RIFOXYD12_FULL_50_11]|uniref:FlgD Ig-like domain-containing protein n=1 Tax=Candidatus Edwardsbacteria bacterium GWF2_54_11 TaxID=1817851 RepID=A0A1F5RFR4_9BACT|nr:MAG: hypothetical protein A2502_01815 [Candidatus Edwardsbacteria bacterium RifOxyC12_full_54_24]OGF09004.1 MAG: hypothetical protein A2273_10270 [Candidatus Edwardsbacteria bacterium RifOxyA12_full_54_48]OGF12467.1 MAG: hypothetical protein A3K15_01310 [Candidatus Edwardsbacteria bacterium GWE2_54_12]OGF12891.1 MAG: hypothetical protein A2024_11725 [Candidatus Edwardsbacteria bacterium GWF2_54_11]OGF17428.1 MAG: hypothetical protein A2509_08450 [Candidatus Edwardsbacteria bacterium RIFOXYD1
MKRISIFAILSLALAILPAAPAGGQTTHNLEIIWQKAKPETSVYWQGWGFAMASGDLNGDGYSDFVTALDSSLNEPWIRYMVKIYIFNGGLTLSTIPSQTIIYDSLGNYPSFCIADFNKDGYGDLAIGDSRGVGVNSEKGQVNIHYGTGFDLNPKPDLVIDGYGSATATNFGQALSAGDINGDGVDDLIIGAPDYGELNARGRVYIYFGDTSGVDDWPDIILNGHTEAGYYENFGNSMDGTMDYNKDGYNDLIIGAYLNAKTGNAAGKIYYYISKGEQIDTIADGWIYGEASYQRLAAYNVSSVPADTNGFASVGWFGTPDWPSTTGSFDRGKCYMVPGDTMGEITPLWAMTGNDLSDSALGYWSCSAGYADNDKLGDKLASALLAFGDPGKVYLWLRRATMRQQPDAYIIGRASTPGGDALGGKIATAADVDGDVKGEFLVSNYFADTGNMIWLCKYTGPEGVAGRPADSGQRPAFRLGQNYPNPFKTRTTINYQLTTNSSVNLSVYNIAGQLVKTLINDNSVPLRIGEGRAGSITWDGRDNSNRAVSNGVYIYKLNMGGKSMAKKMTLIR